MSAFERFAALSFDCYGTLIDWETGIATELDRWARHAGSDATGAGLLTTFGEVETQVQQEQPGWLYPLVLEETLRRIGMVHGIAVSDDDAARFGASVADWPAYCDSAQALQQLEKRYRLIILSNVDRESFSRSNERLGVDFDLIVTAEDVGEYKPSARSFDALFAQLPYIGVERKQLLHVAQSLYHDHGPALAAGMETVWIDRQGGQEGGATPSVEAGVVPTWRFGSMAKFAHAALA